MGTNTSLTWSVVIPVKVLARAKSRLAGLAPADREALVLAMAADTTAAAAACPSVEVVVVVSDDRVVRTEVEALGAEVVPDLPALSARELTAALAAVPAATQAFVADAAGSGTTLYAAGPGAAFSPRFGPESRVRHRLAGAVELDLPEFRGLKRDVDELDDLRLAAEIGLGRHSAPLAAGFFARERRSDQQH